MKRCRQLLSAVLPLKPVEQEFLKWLNDHGEIRPALLTTEPGLQDRIATHPALLWKALNVRNFRQGDV